ncbi:uncharacterized protein LOC121427300, partial [Lytechinus variegatus]|uniref:uncharacterized protein LOC121427300 n=1 Tax=Lytechinus variegatus TaxID=7654 RepID=UPI001BB19C4B
TFPVSPSHHSASWTTWSRWSRCDNRCGVGNQTRSRRCQLTNQTVTMEIHHSNHSCFGDAGERRTCSEYDFDECTLHHLFVPGSWSEWSSWSECSDNCTGHRNRHRLCHPLKEHPSITTRMKRDRGLLCEGNSTQNSSCVSSGCEGILNTSIITAHDEHHHHHHHHEEGQGTSSAVILLLSMIGFILVVVAIIWYFVTSHQRRRKKPYRTNRGNSTQSVFQTKRSSSGESRQSSSTRSFLSWRSKSQESARFSDQQSEESARLLDDEQMPPETSPFRPYRQPSRSTKDDISAEWLWPWETEGDDWAALDFEADTASTMHFDVYMEVDESEEPRIASPERAPSAVGESTEDLQESTENKMVELEKSAEAWFD